MSSFFILRISKLNIQSLSLNRPSLIVSSNLVSFMIALTSISLVSWTDITTRLGPGEVELVFGICLASYSAFSIIRDRKVKEKSQTRYFIALCIGVIFATGSKENGLIVTLIFIYTLSSSYRRNVFASKLFLGAFTFACLSVAVVATNSLLVLIRGSDVYQSPRSVELIVEALLKNITSKKFIFLSIFVLIMYLLNYRYRSATNNARFTIVLFFYSINLSEFVFYYGSPPAARYLILTQLSELVIFGLTLVATIEFVAKKKFRFIVATIVATMLIYFLWTPLNSATAHNQIANSASELSRQWKAELENLSLLVKSDPVIPIVFHEFKVGDEYERIYSAVQFLRFKGIRNPMFLRVGESRAQSDPLNQVLISQLVAISTTGNLSWEINPLSDLQLYRKFHCVAFKTDLRNPSIPNSFNFAQECLSTFNIES